MIAEGHHEEVKEDHRHEKDEFIQGDLLNPDKMNEGGSAIELSEC